MNTEPDSTLPAVSPDLDAEQVFSALKALDAHGPIHLEISAGLAWWLLGWLQLALPHPHATESASARDVESLARDLARRASHSPGRSSRGFDLADPDKFKGRDDPTV